jgi:hypothetical protein
VLWWGCPYLPESNLQVLSGTGQSLGPIRTWPHRLNSRHHNAGGVAQYSEQAKGRSVQNQMRGMILSLRDEIRPNPILGTITGSGAAHRRMGQGRKVGKSTGTPPESILLIGQPARIRPAVPIG